MVSKIALPTDGQTNWGDPLNAFVNSTQTQANNLQTSLNNHAGNNPADPHGDRSYAQSLVTPITSGTNSPNGYVKLNSSGRIIASQITGSGGPGGAYTGVFDAVATYGMTAGTSDSSTACQNACNAAGSAGGGIVWIGPGSFSFGHFVVIPSNVWVLMSEGTTINRITSGTAPAYLFTNIKFDSSSSPNSNIKISGGKLDATNGGTLSSACTPIFLVQSTRTRIEDTYIYNVFSNPAIEFNGCSNFKVNGTRFGGTSKTSGSPSTTPAVRINVTMSTTTPVGLLGSLYGTSHNCVNGSMSDSYVELPANAVGPYAGIAGSDLTGLSQFFHTDLTFTGLSIDYFGNNTFSIYSGGVWSNAVASAINAPEFFNAGLSDGWQNMVLQSGWSNSGSGPNAQWRYVQSTSVGPTASPATNTIEIIGDLTVGTSTDATTFASLTGAVSPNTSQTVVVVFPNGSPSNNARIFYNGNTLKCFGIGGTTGSRMTFHAFLSLTA